MPEVRVLLCLLASASLGGATATVLEGPYFTGSHAAGQAGDVLLANDHVGFVVAAPDHAVNLRSGGNLVDAGFSRGDYDALDEVGVWLERAWPRQAVYTELALAADGTAAVTVTGVDSGDATLEVTTTWSLGDEHTWITATTAVRNTGSATVAGYDLGDALLWGACETWVPGHGEPGGDTTSTWLGCTGLTTSLAYGGASAESLDAAHGVSWTDAAPAPVDLAPGGTHTWTRVLALGGLDVASAADALLTLWGAEAGRVSVSVLLPDGWPHPGAQVHARDAGGDVYTLLEADAAGKASALLPTGTWTLETTGWGVLPESRTVEVEAGAALDEVFALAPDPEAPPSGDTLSLVQRPLPNVPAVVRPGDPLPIEVLAEAASWEAHLVRGRHRVALPVVPSEGGLRATVPEVPLWGLYDLELEADGVVDRVARAVHVIEDFPRTFTFAHITDTHLPTHAYSYQDGWEGDTTEVDDLIAVLDDLAIIDPAFILVTGDLVNEGEVEDYLEGRAFTAALDALAHADLPTFVVAGNHDLGGWPSTYPPAGTARHTWWRFFGWSHRTTQDYSFDYGPVHLVGLESWVAYDDWLPETYGETSFTEAQLAWLRDDLDRAEAEQVVLFYHYDFDDDLDLADLGVDLALWGHIHRTEGSLSRQPWDLSTAATCDGARTYRIVEVVDGALQPRAPLSAGEGGLSLRTVVLPDDSGTHDRVEVRIVNGHAQAFPDGRVRVYMPPGGEWTASGGVLVQVDDDGERALVEVAVDIGAATTTSVEVHPLEPEDTDPPDTGTPDEPTCGCATRSGSLAGLALLLVPLVARRRA